MKNSIIFFGLTLLFAAFMLSCQQQESSPVSPEDESFALSKGKPDKPPKPDPGTSVEYTVQCVLGVPPSPDGYNSRTIVTNYPDTVHKNLKSVKWVPGETQMCQSFDNCTYNLGDYNLSGEAALVFYKKGGKIVSFQFWIWANGDNGWESLPYTTGEVDLTKEFVVPSGVDFTVPLNLDNLTLYQKIHNIKEVIGTISFGDVEFTVITE